MAEIKITTGGKEYLQPAVECLSKCFHDDPALTFLLNSKTREDRIAYLLQYFHVLLKAAILNEASITELNGFSSCAIWMHPGHKVENWRTLVPAGFFKVLWDLGITGCWRMLVDFQNTVNAVKNKELAKYEKYYYMFFVGTVPEAQGKGLCLYLCQGSKLIQHWLTKAAKEEIPIWTEATTSGSHRLYLRLGFQDVKELRIGRGKAAADGTVKKNGDGVPLWTMIWLPPKQKGLLPIHEDG